MHADDDHLTPDQQKLVLEWHKYAMKVFRNISKQIFDFDRDFDIESIISLELCRLARRFDPSRGLKFKTMLSRRMFGLRLDLARSRLPGGFRRERSPGDDGDVGHVPSVSQFSQVDVRSSFWDAKLTSDLDHPVGWEMESIDEVEAIADRLPPVEREVILRIYTEAACAKQKDAAKVMGLTQPQISMIHSSTLKRLKETLVC